MTIKRSIDDPDVQILATLSGTLAPDYARAADDPWIGSPFEWILKVPSRTKGAIGEALVAGWAATKGFDVVRSRNSDADRIINRHRIEIKMSSLWANGGFKFQQIRNQDYDYCLCIGISPFDAQAWLLPKALLLERVIGHMGQHTGAGERIPLGWGLAARVRMTGWLHMESALETWPGYSAKMAGAPTEVDRECAA